MPAPGQSAKPPPVVHFARLLFALCLSPALCAATLTVTNNGDASASSTCTGGAACSLRQAITRANGDSLSDTIEFAIPGSGPHVIAPTTPLPNITNFLAVNGYSQPGAVENSSALGFNAVLKIQLSGASMATNSAGLRVSATLGATIRGLSITGFTGAQGRAIEANSGGQVSVRGCALGLTPAFATAGNQNAFETTANQTGGVSIGASGASALTARNLISGNANDGILLRVVSGVAGVANILNNLIGTAANGNSTQANLGNGITLVRENTFIRDNTIKGNNFGIVQQSRDFTITGNRIGIGGDGSTGGNVIGIRLQSAIFGQGVIGGPGALANTIAGSTGDGIVHSADLLNVDFALNRFFANGQLGVDLVGTDGITANDLDDPDSGPNGLQNFPVIVAATRPSVGGAVALRGTLNSLPNRSFRLVFYANPAADGAGHGEGQFLGDTTVDVTTNAGGDANFGMVTVNFNEGPTAVNVVSATATLIGSTSGLPSATSEFALSVPSQTVVPVVITVTANGDPGNGICDVACTLREAITVANGNGNPLAIDEIRFAIGAAGTHIIVLNSALPVLTEPVTIDGYTQSGAVPNSDASGVGSNAVLRIDIRAATASTFGLFSGFSLTSNITLRGLAVTGFNSSSVDAFSFGGNNVRVEGCWFGVRPDGTEAATRLSLQMFETNYTFGGDSPAQRNVWVNRGQVRLDDGRVSNNLFGVLPSGRDVAVVSQFDVDGAVSTSDGNVTVANNVFATPAASPAIVVNSGAAQIIDNAFGESFDGATVLSLGSAVMVSSLSDARIESASKRIRNPQDRAISVGSTGIPLKTVLINQSILGGIGAGIQLEGNDSNTSLSVRSAISGIAGLGIDLIAEGSLGGVTANDTGDGDSGPNGLQNFPVLSSAARSGSTINVIGSLNSVPNQQYRILLCGIASSHSSNHGGCDEVLDDDQIVSTDGSGNVGFSITVASNPTHQFITATASRIVSANAEQTSELALNIPITGGVVDAIFANGLE